MRRTAVALAALLGACSDPASYIVVELDAARPLSIASVDITLKNAAQTSQTKLQHDPDIVVPPAKTFALKLEPDRRGDVTIGLVAHDRSGVELGRWSGTATIVPGRSVNVRATIGGGVVADLGVGPDMAMPDLAMPDLAMPDLWHRKTLSFRPAAFYGQAGGVIAVADLNRDKVLDVVVTAGNAVDVLLGVGDGTLRNPVRYGVGTVLNGVAVGDLNGDGFLDLAFSDSVCCQFWTETMLGNGDGTFQSAQKYSLAEASYGVDLVDLNADGRSDVVLAHSSSNLGVLLAGVDGKLKSEVSFPLPMGSMTRPVAGDFNGDGRPDVAVIDGKQPGFAVFAGDGTGSLIALTSSAVAAAPGWSTFADMNGDKKLDAVFCAGRDVGVALGGGDGRFGTPWTTFEGAGPVRLVAADLDDDGRPDVAVTDILAGNLAVFLGRGDGTLSDGGRFAVGSNPASIAAADLNGDGMRDLIVGATMNGQTRVAVLINTSM